MCYECMHVRSPDQVISGCCLVEQGYYCIWGLEHMTLLCEDWVELCDLQNVYRMVSYITFNVVSERQRARDSLNNLKREAPFNECKRFPWRKIYVNISCSVYGSILQNLLSALDFKDRESEKELKFSKGKQQDDQDQNARAEFSLDDAKTQYRNNLKIFRNELCKRNEVYDRVKFETKYDLTWCEGECPGEPPYKPPTKPGNPSPPDNPRRYGALLDELKKKNLDPSDFSIFTGTDLLRGDFQCGRDLQTLGEGMRNTAIPSGVSSIYVFTSGEYAKCRDSEDPTRGFNYRVLTNSLIGPITLRPSEGFDLDEDFKDFVEKIDFETVLRNAYQKRRQKYPNSKVPSGIQSPLGSDYAEMSSAK